MNPPAAYLWRKTDGTLLGQVDGEWIELGQGADRDAAMRAYRARDED